MFLFYELTFFKKGDTIQAETLFKGGTLFKEIRYFPKFRQFSKFPLVYYTTQQTCRQTKSHNGTNQKQGVKRGQSHEDVTKNPFDRWPQKDINAQSVSHKAKYRYDDQ